MRYKAFLSYSHTADEKLAPALQSALHRFDCPWYRSRAIRVFRDTTNLSVSPELWPSIEQALHHSQYFILLASPEAAASKWVNKEVDHWLTHKSPHILLLVVTDGEVVWDESKEDFDWSVSTSLPRSLERAFKQEPLYLDSRWVRKNNDTDLSLNNPAIPG